MDDATDGEWLVRSKRSLDDEIFDLSPLRNDGLIFGEYTWERDYLDSLNEALVLDGTTVFAEIPNVSGYNIDDGDFAIEARVYVVEEPSEEYAVIVDKRANDDRYFGLFVQDDGTEDNGRVELGFWASDGNNSITLISPDVVLLNEWVHVAGTREGDNFTLYVTTYSELEDTEGEYGFFYYLPETQTANIGSLTNAGGFSIGAKSVDESQSFFLNGYIDEVRVWDELREMDLVHQFGFTDLLGVEPGCVGLWPCNNNVDFYFYPVFEDQDRRGVGIRVGCRGLQWAHFLAEDCLIWHYEITNISDYNYDKVAFGMIVGTLSGGRQDSEDDLAFFDPNDDITYSWDSDDIGSPGWVPVREGVVNVGHAGYAFLESPGNSFDGIDNDNDSEDPDSPMLTEGLLHEMTVAGRRYPAGDDLVLIDYDTYERTVVTMPDSGSLLTSIRGQDIIIDANIDYVEDGNNGIDDNFNGLIDERLGLEVGGKRLDHLNFRYKNYLSGAGLDDPMIDEARDDGIDNDGDWDPLSDDVGFDGTAGTSDIGEADGVPSDGEPNFDKTDIDESDQIGLTSFEYFSPPGGLRMNDDNNIWNRMLPGLVDVIPGVAEDGDFVYGSGYFPLPSGKTERFSVALFFGEDLEDITNNKQTVQQIYNNNYNFVKPPPKPTVTAVPGDGQVTLYWDDLAESAFDESMPEGYREDFEGYKIYRATDPGFLENFVITDGKGRKVFHKPIAQFDLDNENFGYFPEAAFGVSYYLGDNTGIQHVWTDTTVENGQRYFYAVTAYDFGYYGTIPGAADTLEIVTFFPAETAKTINIEPDGTLTFDKNTVLVTPSVPAAGYKPPVVGAATHEEGFSDGLVYIDVVDHREVEENRDYTITFEKEVSGAEPDTVIRTWYYLSDSETGDVYVNGTLEYETDERPVLDLFNPYFDSLYGLPSGRYNTTLNYSTVETPLFNGMRAYFIKPSRPGGLNVEGSTWYSGSDPQSVSPTREDSLLSFSLAPISFGSIGFTGEERYADYELVFYDEIVGNSTAYTYTGDLPGSRTFAEQPINFTVRNVTGGQDPLVVVAAVSDVVPTIEDDSIIMLLEVDQTDTGPDTVGTWSTVFGSSVAAGTIHSPVGGDTLRLKMYKPFDTNDLYAFTAEEARIDRGRVDLSKIKVYPNPYLGASTQEQRSLIPLTSGRGEQRITFIHLPDKCTIRIYNIRGEIVQTIPHYNDIHDGRETWDLRSKDGLDVAYGVYIYHIDSPYGEHVGKFAIIK